MTWAAYGPQKPSDDGIRWHDVSEDVKQPARVPAGQGHESPAHDKRAPSRIRTCAHGSGGRFDLSL